MGDKVKKGERKGHEQRSVKTFENEEHRISMLFKV